MENEFIISSEAPKSLKHLFNGWIQITCDSNVATAFELNSIANIMVWRGINWDDVNGQPETELVPGPRRFFGDWFKEEPKISVPKETYQRPFMEIILKNGIVHKVLSPSFEECLEIGNEILSAISGRIVIVPKTEEQSQ